MMIHADPFFVAAEVEYRRTTARSRFPRDWPNRAPQPHRARVIALIAAARRRTLRALATPARPARAGL